MFTKLVNTIPPNPQRQSNPEHTIYGVCSRRRTMEGPTDHYAATPVGPSGLRDSSLLIDVVSRYRK